MNPAQRSIDLFIRLAAISALAVWCFLVVRPFLDIMFWAAILAIGLHPVYLCLRKRLGERSLPAAAILLLLGIAIIIGPLTFLGITIYDDVQVLSRGLTSSDFVFPPLPEGITNLPFIGDELNELWQSARQDIRPLLVRFQPQLEQLASFIVGLSATTGATLLKLLLSLLVAAGFMANAAWLQQRIHKVVRRLAPQRSEEFLSLTMATIQNVIRGVIGVAAVQTALVGAGLLLAGIPGAGLLIAICFVLILVQLGPTLVVLPVLIYAWSTMPFISALLLTLWMIPAGLIDNVLKPLWMGKGLPVPILLIFVGVIGGTLSGGVLGLFLGPVILALGYDVLRLWANG